MASVFEVGLEIFCAPLLLLLFISIQQAYVSTRNKTNVMSILLRIALCISILGESIIVVINIYYLSQDIDQNRRSTPLKDVAICFLVIADWFLIYRTVRPPAIYAEKSWAQKAGLIWLILNILQFLWTLVCIMLFLTNTTIMENHDNTYLLEFNVFVIIAATMFLYILFNVLTKINQSIYKFSRARVLSLSTQNAKSSNAQSPSNLSPLSLRMESPTLWGLAKAKYVIWFTISVCTLIIALKLASFFIVPSKDTISTAPVLLDDNPRGLSNAYTTTSSPLNDIIGGFSKINPPAASSEPTTSPEPTVTRQPRESREDKDQRLQLIRFDLVHYIIVSVFYILLIVSNWIPSPLTTWCFQLCPCSSKKNAESDGKSGSDTVSKQNDVILDIGSMNQRSNSNDRRLQVHQNHSNQNGIASTMELAAAAASPQSTGSPQSSGSPRSTGSPRSAGSPRSSAIPSMMPSEALPAALNPTLSPNTTLKSHSDMKVEDTAMGQFQLPDLNTPLHRINEHGQMIGKRGAAKPRRSTKLQVDGQAPFMHDANETAQQLNDESMISGCFDMPEYRPSDTQIRGDELADLEHDLDHIIHPISIVVFEFDHVIRTSAESLAKLDTMTKIQKSLHFGGAERIKTIQTFLRQIQMEQSGSLSFYILSSGSCRKTCELLSDTDLLRYFVTYAWNGTKNGKMLPPKMVSNVIGWNHKSVDGCRGKRHLMLLKLMQSAGVSHDDMLYVGHDKKVIEHLEGIGICRTYFCETKGLTEDGIHDIKRQFF